MLKLENIHKTFHAGTVNQKIALDGLSLTLNDGDFVTVIGGNGAGKSTLLNTAAANAAGLNGPSPPPTAKISAGSSRSWTWDWRIVFPPRSACFPAASGRRLPCLWPL